MTQEEKSLLLQDLCARLPYNLYIRVEEFDVPENDGRITEGFIGNYLKDNRCSDYDADDVLNELADGCIDIKPYLRSMSSMTEAEEEEYDRLNAYEVGLFPHTEEAFEWLLEYHFDFMCLIPKGLALEAPEGMYNF
jgi:hypothetical protein